MYVEINSKIYCEIKQIVLYRYESIFFSFLQNSSKFPDFM